MTAPQQTLDYATPRATSGRYKWLVVAMLWCVCFLNNADRLSIVSIFPRLRQLYGFDAFQQGLITSAFMWVYALNSPLAGYAGDRLKRKNLILGGCFFWSLVAAATGLCTTFWQFITARALEGFGETFYFPASMSLISDYHGPRTRSRAMSFHQSSVYFGSIAGSWFTALLAERFGWQVGFYAFGAAGVILSIALLGFLCEPARGQMEAAPPGPVLSPGESAAALWREPVAMMLMVGFFGANFVSTVFVTWTPTFLVQKFHFKLSSAGLSGSVFIFLACAVGAPLGGILADKFSTRFVGSRMLVQAAGLIFGSSFIFLVGTTHNIRTLLVSMTFFGLGKGLYDSNIFASMYDVIDPRARASAAGIMNTLGWCGGALGPVFVGALAKYGRGTEVENMSRALASTAIIYLAVASLLITASSMFVRRNRRLHALETIQEA